MNNREKVEYKEISALGKIHTIGILNGKGVTEAEINCGKDLGTVLKIEAAAAGK